MPPVFIYKSYLYLIFHYSGLSEGLQGVFSNNCNSSHGKGSGALRPKSSSQAAVGSSLAARLFEHGKTPCFSPRRVGSRRHTAADCSCGSGRNARSLCYVIVALLALSKHIGITSDGQITVHSFNSYSKWTITGKSRSIFLHLLSICYKT